MIHGVWMLCVGGGVIGAVTYNIKSTSTWIEDVNFRRRLFLYPQYNISRGDVDGDIGVVSELSSESGIS
jgi:hypothetical protein